MGTLRLEYQILTIPNPYGQPTWFSPVAYSSDENNIIGYFLSGEIRALPNQAADWIRLAAHDLNSQAEKNFNAFGIHIAGGMTTLRCDYCSTIGEDFYFTLSNEKMATILESWLDFLETRLETVFEIEL